jgi:hypothetical protein
VTARGRALEQGGRAAGGAREQQVVAPRLPLTRGQRQVYWRAFPSEANATISSLDLLS